MDLVQATTIRQAMRRKLHGQEHTAHLPRPSLHSEHQHCPTSPSSLSSLLQLNSGDEGGRALRCLLMRRLRWVPLLGDRYWLVPVDLGGRLRTATCTAVRILIRLLLPKCLRMTMMMR